MFERGSNMIRKLVQKSLVVFSLTALFATTANAASFAFDVTFASFHLAPKLLSDYPIYGRVFDAVTSGSATVDVVGDQVTLNLTATGTVFGLNSMGAVDYTDIKVTNAVMTQTLVMSGVNQINSPFSVTTQTPVSGTTTVSDVGLGGGPVTVSSMAAYMDWSTYMGPDAGHGFIQQMANLGPANFWMGNFSYLWASNVPLPAPVLRFDMWYKVGSDFTYNGINFSGVTAGDTHGTAAVPEPATLGLLGAGLVGLMARRRRA